MNAEHERNLLPRPTESRGESIAKQAQAWHVRLKDPSATDLDRRDFEAWRGKSAAHAAAYDQSERMWHLLAGPAQALRADRLQRVPVSRPRARHFALALAMCFALVMVAVLLVDPGRIDRLRADYANAPGGPRTFSLREGSTITLDGDAAINVSLTRDARNVELLRGRAWFDVSPDANRPFLVAAGPGKVRVLGTAFTVDRLPDETRVVVERGRVSVSSDGSRESATLLAGEQARLAEAVAPTVDTARADAVFAWRSGWLVFEQEPLMHVVNAIEHQGGGRVIVMRPAVGNRRISGIFRSNDPDAVLAAVESGLDLQIVRIPGIAVLIF